MENASKALLMASGVLIGILILSLAVYLFTSFGADSRRIQQQIDTNQLIQYNAQYTIYSGRKDITIYEIISTANLATENNNYYKDYTDTENTHKVEVYLSGKGYINEFTQEQKQALLQQYNIIASNGNLKYAFTCQKIEYHDNGKVSKIIFKLT